MPPTKKFTIRKWPNDGKILDKKYSFTHFYVRIFFSSAAAINLQKSFFAILRLFRWWRFPDFIGASETFIIIIIIRIQFQYQILSNNLNAFFVGRKKRFGRPNKFRLFPYFNRKHCHESDHSNSGSRDNGLRT